MKKKGVSPLIATVLIIGFTILLAVFIINWGQNFVKYLTEQKGKEAMGSLECLNVNLDLKLNCESGKVTIENNADKTVTDFLLRARKEDGTIGQVQEGLNKCSDDEARENPALKPCNDMLPIEPYGVKNFDTGEGLKKLYDNRVKSYRVIPIIEVEDEEVTCGQRAVETKLVCLTTT